jgi:transcriptional regulator with XRE-family HTH domain
VHHDLHEWGEVIGAVLSERRISNNAAAQAVGVSPATFASWMNGATRPSVDALPAIAELTGLALWRVYKLAGYLPSDYSPAAAVFQAVESQQSLYAELQRWAEFSLAVTGLSPAARAVGLIVGHDPTWQLTVRPNIRGTEYAIAANTLIGLERSRPRAEPLHHARADLEKAIGRELVMLGAIWRDRSVPGWENRPALLLEVPEHERTRSRGQAPAAGFPPTIGVVGVPYAHAELVGSLLAEAIDYGYINTKTEAAIRAETGMGAGRDELARAAAEMVRENLNTSRPRALDKTIWTCSHPEAIQRAEGLFDAADPRTHFVYVRAGARLIEFGADVWRYPAHVCQDAAHRLDGIAERLGAGRCTVVEIMDEAVFGDGEPQHQVADATVEAAIKALGVLAPQAARRPWKGYLGRIT